MEPVVSVLIPAYQAGDTIARTVASLIAQSFSAWRAVIAADDGQDYRAILAAAGVVDARLEFTDTGRIGAGPSAARNAGLRRAATPLIAALDADDLFLPERLARLAPLALVKGAAVDNVQVVWEREPGRAMALFPVAAECPQRLTVAEFLATSAPMFPVFRRDLAGDWDAELTFAEDVAFNLRILDRLGAMPLVAEPLYQYRVRPGSLSASADSAGRAERAYGWMLARLVGDGFGLTDPRVRDQAQTALEVKRALNRRFAVSGHRDFQAFVESERRRG